MGILKWFMGGGETVEKITDAVINGADKIFYTEEEKAEASQKRADLYFKFLELARDESSIKSVTRRIIAVLVVSHWLLYLDAAFVLYLTGHVEKAKFCLELSAGMFAIVGGIMAFYFGSHLLRQYQKPKQK